MFENIKYFPHDFDLFELNDYLEVEEKEIGEAKVLIVDNLYKYPDLIREFALNQTYDYRRAIKGSFPGGRTNPIFGKLNKENIK